MRKSKKLLIRKKIESFGNEKTKKNIVKEDIHMIEKKKSNDISLTKPKVDEVKKYLSKKDQRNTSKIGVKNSKIIEPVNFKEYGEFVKDESSEYDAAFVIATHNRFNKLERLVKQITSQKSKYKFKVYVINDGSDDPEYDNLPNKYDIVYLKNEVAGGKLKYYKTVNKLWSEAKKCNPQTFIQLDDDFIICNNFLDILMDKYYEIKKKTNNYMAMSFHKYTFSDHVFDKPVHWWNEDSVSVDGGILMDMQFLSKFNYELDDIERRITKTSAAFTWVRISERLREYGMKVYRFDKSLVWHDGNEDSKLHEAIRKIKKMYTKDFIDGNR